MFKVLAIMVGGGLGAASRHGVFLAVQRLTGGGFPAGTLAANLCGSLLIGFLWHLFDQIHITREFRLFLFTGLLGGFTTFSTFARESTQLIQTGGLRTALVYIILSNALGILCVFGGYFLARHLLLAGR